MKNIITRRPLLFLAAGFASLGLTLGYFRFQPLIGWKIDQITAYVNGMINPVTSVPTPQPIVSALTSQPVVPTQTPRWTPTAAARELPPTPSPTPLPDEIQLAVPAWEKQDLNNCGPATMTMYLRYYGWEGNQTDIAEQVKPERGDRNVNVEELIYYVRTNAGWLNAEFRVGGSVEQLRQLLAGGFPVMVEKGFLVGESYWPNDDRWAGHYVLLTGYSRAADTFTAQDSFDGPNQTVPAKYLDENWKTFNRVMILVYPPDREEALKTILGNDWDVIQNRENALQESLAETAANPEDVFAWFNLGTNYTYFERYDEAVAAYNQARMLGWPQRMLRYQFGPFIAYFNTGQTEELLTLAEYTLERTPNSEEAHLWYGWAEYRQKGSSTAKGHFEEALKDNRTYADAGYALDYLAQNP